MKLQKLIDDKEKVADWMVDDITHICKDFEKRDPGSKGELQACEYMADLCKNEYGCDTAEVESFKENPDSFFGLLWITMALFGLGVILDFVGWHLISVILYVFGWVIAFLQFGCYFKFVDKLYPEKTGHSMMAIKKPTGEVKRRILFNGHADAVWEWPVNYALGGVGFESHAVITAIGGAYYLVISIISMVKYGLFQSVPTGDVLFKMMLWGLLFTPFWFGMNFLWNRKRIVDGANDNLSGCYMGLAVLKELEENGIELENTEVGVIITGSEEAGLRGAKAWCEAHEGEFQDVPTFIYSYDTIYDPKYLMANYRDLNGTVKTDKDANDLFMEAAQELGFNCKKGWVPPLGGATDTAAFTQGGFRSGGITGLNHKLENYYHTRRDSYDNMNKQGLAECYAITVKVLEKFDDGAKQ